MSQVPELFSNFMNSFAGCAGGNPDAPIWLVAVHSFHCELPIDPQKTFAKAPTNVDSLLRALPSDCKCSNTIARLVNSIDGNEEGVLDTVFKPAGQEKNQPIFCLAVSPLCLGLATGQAWSEKPAVLDNGKEVTMSQYTGLETYSDYWKWLLAPRGELFRKAVAQKTPKIIICQDISESEAYFKFFGADSTQQKATDFFTVAPIMAKDGTVQTLVFVTDAFSLGINEQTPESDLQLQQTGNAIRNVAHEVFGDGWLGKFAGTLLKSAS